jgi:hypothetical protein
MNSLEGRYRRLLRAYPPGYRHQHQEELLATLLDAARPGQRHPSLREATALLIGGLRTRVRLVAGGSTGALWAEGLRLGSLLLLVSMTGQAASLALSNWLGEAGNGIWSPWRLVDWLVMLVPVLALVALARGAFMTGLLLVVAPVMADRLGVFWAPANNNLAYLPGCLLVAGLCVLLRWRRPIQRRRAWPWLLATPLTLVVGAYGYNWWSWQASTRSSLTVALLLLALLSATLDPRVTIAAGIYVTPLLLGFLHLIARTPGNGLEGSQLVILLIYAAVAGLLLVAGHRSARRLSRL